MDNNITLRLSVRVINLILAIVILSTEALLHILWIVLPLNRLERLLQQIYHYPTKYDDDATSIKKFCESDFVEFCEALGYETQEHYCYTDSGYILGLHRIISPVAPSAVNQQRPVVYLQHGFMQCSEAWIAAGYNDKSKSLAFYLADQGYDVWCGNSRGNKYSYKHVKLSPNTNEFFNYSLDNLAMEDVPTTIDYVLNYTGAKTLSYIGFSQGTCLGFAAFSAKCDLSKKVNLFIALAPCTVVKGLHNKVVRAITMSRPGFVYLLFGRKAILGEMMFWRSVLSRELLVFLIDMSMKILFGWNTSNIAQQDKQVLYSHLYSYSSVKCLVHWFQIVRTNRFQMYDEKLNANNFDHSYKPYILPHYQPHLIQVPLALFIGEKDTIPNTDSLLGQVPKSTVVHREPDYEHLDFIWANNANEKVWPKVLNLLQEYNK